MKEPEQEHDEAEVVVQIKAAESGQRHYRVRKESGQRAAVVAAEQWEEIRQRREAGKTVSEIAREFGIDPRTGVPLPRARMSAAVPT